MLLRSKSAPKHLDELATDTSGASTPLQKESHLSGTRLLSRSHTAHMPLDAFFVETGMRMKMSSRSSGWEDPFNLMGFFPSRPTEAQTEWDWIKAGEKAGTKEETMSLEESEDALSLYGDEEIRGASESSGRPEGSYSDEMARQVIDGEDKMGMLAFSSEKIPTLLQNRMPALFEGARSVRSSATWRDDDEPVEWNPETVYSRHCLRRQNSIQTEDHGVGVVGGESLPLGMLFLTKDMEGQDGQASSMTLEGLPHWYKVVTGWVAR